MPLQYIGEPFAVIPFVNVAASPDNYEVIIYKRDYTGDPTTLIGAAVPALLQYENDDPFAPIQGSTLRFSYVTSGTFPVSNFYGENDIDFQVELTRNGTSVWVGWLQQDDISDLLVEYNREIQLTAQCGLGFLKNVRLDAAMKAANNPYLTGDADVLTYHHVTDYLRFCLGATSQETDTGIYCNIETNDAAVTFTANMTAVAGTQMTLLNTTHRMFAIGMKFDILSGINAGTFTVLALNQVANDVVITTAEATVLQTSTSVQVRPLLRQYFFDTLLKATSYNQDDRQWVTCYEVLEGILGRLNASVFMADSRWNIVRWQEFRYYNDYEIPGRRYTQTFAQPSAYITHPGATTDNLYLAGLTQRLFRPWKYAREQFDYNQPGQILRNFDLQQLGALRTSYPSGGNTVYEYDFTHWSKGQVPETADFFIRVVRDTATGTELERYVVVSGTVFDSARTVACFPIEGNKGDVIEFEFEVRTTTSIPGSSTNIFAVSIDDGVLPLYVDDINGRWKSTIGFNYSIVTGDNFNEWHTVRIKSQPLPHDGLIYCFLSGFHTSGGETRYRDMRFTYTRVVSESTKVTGHVHRTEQDEQIKNNSDVELKIDTAPSNNIAGNLFLRLKDEPNVVQVKPRTTIWRRGHNMDGRTLGQIITFEDLLWRLKPRVIVEGGRYGSATDVSKLRPLTVPHFPGKLFLSGRMEIDFRNNTTTATLYELLDAADTWDPAPELETTASFTGGTNVINVVLIPGQYFFRVGDSYTITGTANNNVTFTVTSINRIGVSDSYTIGSSVALTNELGVLATFTANDNSQWILPDNLYTFNYLYNAR